MDRNFVRLFLKVNDASESMPDEVIAQVLERAGWSAEDITLGINLLCAQHKPSLTNTKENIFRSDLEFSSDQLSRLLGVDVVIDPQRIHSSQGQVMAGVGGQSTLSKALSAVAIMILASGLAVGAGIFAAYFFEIGPFTL